MATTRRSSGTRPRGRAVGWPTRLHVDGLFRSELSRQIKFRTEGRITILTGPNGSGKTRLLSTLRAILAFDIEELARQPFHEAIAEFSSGRSLRVSRTLDKAGATVGLSVYTERNKLLATCAVNLLNDPAASLALPSFVHRVDESLWQDSRDGELLHLDDLMQRFPRSPSPGEAYSILGEQPPDGLALIHETLGHCPSPTFVRTQRLDVEQDLRSTSALLGRRRIQQQPGRIYDYVAQIQTQVAEARASYSRISQRADSQFASKALDKSGGDPPLLPDLRLRFDQLATLHRELLATGLFAETPGIEMGGGTLTKPERRFLSVFLDDWRRKLDSLVPVHEKLQMLQQIVGSKLDRKRIGLNEQGLLLVETHEGAPIPVDQLSSGEQHLLALFAMLLFSANPGSVVLIDEPEISLHTEWKHAFLDDIRRVAETADLHLVLATHSTGIINGQWDLVEEL